MYIFIHVIVAASSVFCTRGCTGQFIAALYKHPDLSDSAAEINDNAHITVDKMSQCGS